MSIRSPFLFLATALTLTLAAGANGCGHTRSVGDTNATPPRDQTGSADGKSAQRTSNGGAAKSEKREAVTTPRSPSLKSDSREGAPPLATSPAGLLRPQAVQNIQEKLISNGRLASDHESGKLDEPTREALRDFQRSNHLPATGMPDDVTVQKLGLGTEDIFRASQGARGGQEQGSDKHQ